MTIAPRYPSLYQLNTRVWLRRLSRERDKRVTLAEIDDATIDGFARQGFDWIWLLSVWRTGLAGRAVSRMRPEWRAEFSAVLPALDEDDICGSGFAVTAYTVSDEIGGDAALAQFRERLAQRDMKAMLDFVPNHTAPDHPWVKSNPDLSGSSDSPNACSRMSGRLASSFLRASNHGSTSPSRSRIRCARPGVGD